MLEKAKSAIASLLLRCAFTARVPVVNNVICPTVSVLRSTASVLFTLLLHVVSTAREPGARVSVFGCGGGGGEGSEGVGGVDVSLN